MLCGMIDGYEAIITASIISYAELLQQVQVGSIHSVLRLP